MNYIDVFKNGSGIHIKKKNRGKFTASAKAAGESVLEHAHSVMNDPNATILQKRRANFAIQAKKWHHKHEDGGIISAKNGMDTSRVYYDSEEFKTTPKESIFDNTILTRVNKWNSTKTERTDREEIEDAGWDDLFTETSAPITETHSYSISEEPIKDISGDLKTLLGMFKDAGIKVKMTSGYREGAVTKHGKPSHHSTGNAMDIVPEDGDFNALANAIRNNQQISNFMKSKGFGILDETGADMLAKTGGTGAHFHIGPDKIAQNFWKV